MNQRYKKLLRSRTSRDLSDTEEEDTIMLAGREITISQEVHIRADIVAARSVLQNLKNLQCYTTPVIKVIES